MAASANFEHGIKMLFFDQYPNCEKMGFTSDLVLKKVLDGRSYVFKAELNLRPSYNGRWVENLPPDIFLWIITGPIIDRQAAYGEEMIQFLRLVMKRTVFHNDLYILVGQINTFYEYEEQDPDENTQPLIVNTFRRYFNVHTQQNWVHSPFQNDLVIRLRVWESSELSIGTKGALRKPLLIQGVKF
jgi:hypothetical protein